MPVRTRSIKWIMIGAIVTAVIGTSITLLITSAWKDYAKVGYQLSSSKWAYSGESLEVDLRLNNEGNLDVVPVSTITVVNATIQRVSIPNVAEYQLSRYCSYDNLCATITNLTITSDWGLATWESIYVIPNEGATSFGVYSQVTLPFDLLHPNSKVIRIIPYELVYNYAGNDVYELLD